MPHLIYKPSTVIRYSGKSGDFSLYLSHEPAPAFRPDQTTLRILAQQALLKVTTSDSKKSWFRVGDYKSMANVVGGMETTLPDNVSEDMKNLIETYHSQTKKTMHDIIDFHFQFERIHPFQDVNGRVGRLIIFKECLANDIIPFIKADDHKFFYYRGLTEYPKVKEYLIDTCLSAQDNYKKMLDYFLPKSNK